MHEWYYAAIWWQRITVLDISWNLVSFCCSICESVKIWKGPCKHRELQGIKTNKEPYFLRWRWWTQNKTAAASCSRPSDHREWLCTQGKYLSSRPFYSLSTTLWKKENDTQIWKLTLHFFLHHVNVKLWSVPQPSQERFANPLWCGQRLLLVGWKVGR